MKKTQSDMEKSEARQAKLAEEAEGLQKDLSDIQRQLVRAAAAVQKSEAELTGSEEKLRILTGQLSAKQEALKDQEKKLATLTEASIKLSRMPPEAMVMMPGDAKASMRAARVLKMTQQSIRREMESLRRQMRELKNLEEKVVKRRNAIASEQDRLDKERVTVAARQNARKRLLDKLGKERQEEAERAAELARKAVDLEGLVDSLQQSLRRKSSAAPEPATKALPPGQKGRLRGFVAARGHARPPLAGKVVRSFGAAEGKDGTSKGLVIAARERAQVVAPFDGEVVFAGPFLNYGSLIILKHSDDFHTLLSGLAKITARPGEFLLEGEPIGAMGDKADSRLYVELRKNNQPVDPAQWIGGLTSE